MSTITIGPTIDSYMEMVLTPDNNFGSDALLFAKVAYIGENKSLLINSLGNFDVSAVAADNINSASLWLYTFDSGDAASVTISRVKAHPDVGGGTPPDWVEDEVTWNSYSAGNAWDTAGGDTDEVNPTKVTFTIQATEGWQEIVGLAGHVTDAIADRANIVALELSLVNSDPDSNAGNGWYSREMMGTEFIPPALAWYLRIDYTPASPAGIPFIRPSIAQRALLRR